MIDSLFLSSHWLPSHINTLKTMVSDGRGKNPVAMTIINPQRKNWRNQGSNQRPPVFKCWLLPSELQQRWQHWKLNPFPKQALVFTCLQYKSFQNTVGNGEIARKEQFLLFPLCFLPIWTTFWHFHQIWNCRLQIFSVSKTLKFVVWERVKPENITNGDIIEVYIPVVSMGLLTGKLCCFFELPAVYIPSISFELPAV